MDNITHTLAGLAVAEAALALRGRKTPVPEGLARGAWLGSALANNLPDVDFAYAGITGSPLGYLLHHRGHTHTLALAPVVAIVPFLLGRLLQKRGGDTPSRSSDVFLYLLCLLGSVLHIVLDFGNSYGVHPFWPLSSAWHYGDTIFIVEPAWWLTLAIPLALSVKWRPGRFGLLGIALAGIVLAIVTGYVSSLAIAALAIGGLVLYLGASRLETAGGRATLAVAGTMLVALTFASARSFADSRARSALDGAFPRATEIDLVMSPEPANPFCWSVLAIAVEGEGDAEALVLRRLVVATVPSVHAASLCRLVPAAATTADDAPIERPGHDDVRFFAEARIPLVDLRAAAERCDAAAFLRFSRAPFLTRGEERTLGDYRFDREEGRSFSELVLSDPIGDCPAAVPGWDRPRADVLDGTWAPEVHPTDVFE